MKARLAIAVFAAFAAGAASSQSSTVEYLGTTNYGSDGLYGPIGWSSDGSYFAYGMERNGGGAVAIWEQHVVGYGGRMKAMISSDEGDGESYMADVSADLLQHHGISTANAGHLIFSYPVSFFDANRRLKAWSSLKQQYSFVEGGQEYRVFTRQSWANTWTTVNPFGEPVLRYKKASVGVFLELPSGEKRELGSLSGEDALGYSIDAIHLSPDRKRIAVVLARFTQVWFEGNNIQAEYRAVLGTLQ